MHKTWIVGTPVEWVYERPEGDLTTFARTAREAMDIFESYGFLRLDIRKLKVRKPNSGQFKVAL